MEDNEIKEIEKQNDRMDEILNYLEKISEKDNSNYDKKEDKKIKHLTLLYFFATPSEKGIKLIDCSPKGSLARFAGNNSIEENILSKKSATFIVKKDQDLNVDWDNNINEVNKVGYLDKKENDKDITYINYTFIVSSDELKKIERQVNESEVDSEELIHIKVDNLYDFDLEYRFYKELADKNKINEQKYDTDDIVIPKENIVSDISLDTEEEITNNRKNNMIKTIEEEEKKLDKSVDTVKSSKASLINFKRMLSKAFSKNKKVKNDNNENSKTGFKI